MAQNLKIQTSTISIRTLLFDSKKLTKSMFSQILHQNCFDKDVDFLGNQIFGFIKDKGHFYLVWEIGGMLRKTNITDYYRFQNINEYTSFDEFFNRFCAIKDVELHNGRRDCSLFQSVKDNDRFDFLRQKINVFMDALKNQQIFI